MTDDARKDKCAYCDGAGEIEMDNNGPIVTCPVCALKKEADFWDTDLDDIEAGFLPKGTKVTDLPVQNSMDGIPTNTTGGTNA